MNRSVAMYAGLLVVALGASYLSWTSEGDEAASGKTVVARFDPADIERIEYTSDEAELTLDVRKDERGRYVWVEEKRSIPVGPGSKKGEGPEPDETGGSSASTTGPDAGGNPDAGSPDAGPPDAATSPGSEPATETEKKAYKASAAAGDLLDSLAPLEATRQLDVATEKQKKRYGLADPSESMTIHLKSGSARTFQIGDYAYGRRHVYIRDQKTGRAYAIDAGTIGPLKYSESRLPEHSLVDASLDDVKRVVVERGDRRIEMVHKNMADRSAAYWTLASGPDEKNSSASSWLRKLFRLRIDSFAADRSRDTLETAFTATVHPRSGKTTKIEFFKGPAEETSSNEKSAKASQPTWFGRSGFTRELVELATDRVSTLASDIETLKSKGQGSESSDGSE